MSDALKPCPFCGNTRIKVDKYRTAIGVHYYAQCDYAFGGCGAELASRISRKEAIKDWNSRARGIPQDECTLEAGA